MFSTFKSKVLLGVYIFLLLSIPVGAYLASESTSFKSKASENTTIVKSTPKPTSISASEELLDNSETAILNNPTSTPASTPDTSTPTIATSFGPTLSLKVSLEGRPTDNQTTKLFVGIFEGNITLNPKFILSFSIDIPAGGSYSNLSLAGLTSGTTYTALLKSPAQLASASTFVMSPTVTNLNNGDEVKLLTGDLNEDNIVNTADLTVAQKALGANKQSANWNENADFNLDGLINSFDLALIYKNMDAVGASGVWSSPLAVATPSASLNKTPSTGSTQGGYWLWMP